jgi:hypothetical protein
MPPALIAALLAAGFITEDVATQLASVGDLPADRVDEIAAELTDRAAGLLGGDEDPDPEPVTDDVLAAAGTVADGVQALRDELARRTQARSAVLTRLNPSSEGTTTGEPHPPTPPPAPRHPARLGRVGVRGAQHRGGGAQAVRTTLTAGGRPIGPDQLPSELGEALRQAMTSPLSSSRRVVATERAAYPEHLTLGRDAYANRARINAVTGPQALTASGGMCGPQAPLYSIDHLTTDARPIRDTALARFGADRGGVVTLSPLELPDLAPGVGLWTNQNDIDAGLAGAPDPTKATVTLACPTELETLVQAITASVKFGTFKQRFFPESIEAAMEVLAAAHARLAEQTLLTAMVAGSVAVTTARALGAARDVLEALDRAIAAMRARQRMSDTQRLRLVAPAHLRSMIRADVLRELPGATAERLAMFDEELANWLAIRGVTATWSLDFDVTPFLTQAAGALVAWPATTRALLYPEGAWLFLDGGSLDLGVIRDSTLVATNDAMAFSETFEGVVLTGPESLAMTMTISPSGETSGTVDLTP